MTPLYKTRESFSNTALYTTTPQPCTSEDGTLPSCSICDEECTLAFMGSTHHMLQMPSCSHIFGASCIESWFDCASTCPLCRKHFFPMEPEEISNEIQEIPDLFSQLFTALSEVKKRYPQGRTAVTDMENMIAGLGEQIVKDTEERKKRKDKRDIAVWTEQRRQDVEDLRSWRRQVMLELIEDRPSPLPPRSATPQASDVQSIGQDIINSLAHDFAPDIAALDGSGMLAPGTAGRTPLRSAQRLVERDEGLGLSKATQDVRKRSKIPLSALMKIRQGWGWWR